MGRKGSMPSAAQAARRAAAKARTNMPAEKKMESDKKKQESENRKKKESAPAALIQMMTGPIPQGSSRGARRWTLEKAAASTLST